MLALQGLRSLGLRSLCNPALAGCLGDRLTALSAQTLENSPGTRLAHSRRPEVHSTTVLCVRKDGQVSDRRGMSTA